MKTVLAISACLMALAGCQDSEEQRLLSVANAATKSIAERYKDPDAVLFKDLMLDSRQQHICGSLNAKNGFGAYTGYETFRADLKGSGAATVVTSVWTHRDKLNQIFDDQEAGRITSTEADKATLKTIFEVGCSELNSSENPIYIPVKS